VHSQQLTALSISTASVTKLLVIEQLLHPALKSTVSASWPNFQLCPSSQQIVATPLPPLVEDDALTGDCKVWSGWIGFDPLRKVDNTNSSSPYKPISDIFQTHRQTLFVMVSSL